MSDIQQQCMTDIKEQTRVQAELVQQHMMNMDYINAVHWSFM